MGSESVDLWESEQIALRGLCVAEGCARAGRYGGRCGRHHIEHKNAQHAAMDAALDRIDALPTEEQKAHWAKVKANPKWKRTWWEPAPPPENNRYVALRVKREVALRYGATPGAVVPVECPFCGERGEILWEGKRVRFAGLHLDHIQPLSRGGPSTPENLQALCPTCNMRKGARVEG